MPNDAQPTTIRTIRFDAATQPDEGKRMTSKNWYQRDGFRAGFWAAQPGRADIHYTKDELCTLLEGEVRRQALLMPAVVDLPPGDAARLVEQAEARIARLVE